MTALDVEALTDEQLLARFEATDIPLDQWTHRTHVRVAYTYLTTRPWDDAVQAMRHGIPRYNAAHDIPESPETGYHDTLTVAFMHLINAARVHWQPWRPEGDSRVFCDHHRELMCKTLTRLYYTRPTIMSAEAKRSFIEPDLAPFPVVDQGDGVSSDAT
ncbi:MAG: hypothetical protein AAF432_10715 [Planctomycetota bacterium]